jgi:succinylglutamate desuccinylase
MVKWPSRDKGEIIILPSHIWHLKGSSQSGSNVVVLGGTHGDELEGIEVIRRFLNQLGLLNKPSGVFPTKRVRGNLYIGFGNPKAMLRNTRSASE